MIDSKKIELFEKMPVHRAVAVSAIPTVLSCLVMVLYNLADTYFVGMLNDPIENAAVTLAAPVMLAFNAVNNLFGVGSSSAMSRALGAKNYEKVKRCSSFGFYCALAFSLAFSIAASIFKPQLLGILGAKSENFMQTADYMKWTVVFGAAPSILNVVLAYIVRSEGSALHASIGTMSGCALNIILDPFFILPQFLNMGAAGAGLATFISNSVACMYFFVLLTVTRKRTFVSLNPKNFKPSREIAGEIFGVGVPASIQNLLNVTGMTIMNNSVSEFGSEAVAAMGISQKTTMIPMYFSMGIAQGVLPIIGYNYSAKNNDRLKATILFTAKISMSIMICAAAVYFGLSRQIITLFMKNRTIIEYGSAFTKGLCLAQPFLAMDFLAVGVFQACGMGRSTLIFSILRKIVLEIPALIILNKIYPMYGLAYAQLCAETVLGIAAVICIRNIFNNLNERKQA